MNFISCIFIALITINISYGQPSDSGTTVINETLLIDKYRRKCDSLRIKKHLPVLNFDACLCSAAQHHVRYLARENKQGHTEKNAAMRTVKLRIQKFCTEPRSAYGENQLMSYAESPYLFQPLFNREYNSAYEDLAHELFLLFYYSKPHYDNMIFKGYHSSATAVYYIPENNSLRLVDVFSGY